MKKYAHKTRVPVSQSRSELEKILKKYGASQFSSGWTEEKAVVLFRMKDRYIRVEVPLIEQYEDYGGHYETRKVDEREERRRWRALILYVKAKLESVESEIVSFEQAFLGHIILPNKQTVGEFMQPQIEAAYGSGDMPKQLPGY